MSGCFELKKPIYPILFLALIIPFFGISQYTDVINSNRPGLSVSAYAIGKNVLQLESGIFYEQQDHNLLNTHSTLFGTDIALRYGLLFERLELIWEGTYQNQDITFDNFGISESRTDFYKNRIGLKFLIYDRYKEDKPNLYSWKANNVFRLKNLIPSVSLYAGANFVLGDNPFYLGDPTISPRVMVATQSRLSPRFVLISNISYDRIGTDFPELGYTISLSHAFRNPKWSVFVENQAFESDRYADVLLRSGVAYLFNENLQTDIHMGASFKNTPSRIFISAGVSYRFDFHKDTFKAIEDQNANENGGAIKKSNMKKKSKKKKNKGKGAEDIDLGPSKKQLRKLKKEQEKDNGL
ncbi:transporter [Maribacter polysaccharolyticus]|uniref:transporter n=1 Tax=Maribacter polysaccharolyticus TaxID=3020831 RepID=UPI00237FBFC8|nr:transporter [Maribacter polysaccharolyticus]MDE3743361.1 transporter [Maribacter polysaccharolyticus]